MSEKRDDNNKMPGEDVLIKAFVKCESENVTLKKQIHELQELALFVMLQATSPQLPYKEARDVVKKMVDKYPNDIEVFLEQAWENYREAMKNNSSDNRYNSIILKALNDFLDE